MAFVKNKFVRSYSINSSSSSIQTAKIIVNKKDIEKIPNFSSISGSDPILDNNLLLICKFYCVCCFICLVG